MSVLHEAFAAFRAGRLEDAAGLCARAAENHFDAIAAFHLLTVVRLNQGDPQAALEANGRVLALADYFPEAQFNRGVVLEALGRPAEAVDSYQEALRLRPSYADAACNLGHAVQAMHGPEAALPHYDRAVTLNPRYAIGWLNRGLAMKQLGRADEAIDNLRRALDAEPALGEAWFHMADILRALDRPGEALAVLDEGLARVPQQAELHYDRANILAAAGQGEAAVAGLMRAVELAPGHFNAWGNLGVALQGLGRPAEALEAYTRALAIRPGDARMLANRGAALHGLGRPAEALAELDGALALEPANVDAIYSRGVALFDLGRLDEALAAFDASISLRPDLVEAIYARGNALMALGRLDDALVMFADAADRSPDFLNAWSNQGVALQRLGRHDEALACYERAAAIGPGFAPAYYNRGVSLQALGRYDEAMADYARAIAADPAYVEPWGNTGVVRHYLGRFEEALEAYDKALEINPKHAATFANRGVTLQALRRREEALADHDRAIALNPGYPDAHFNRAVTLDDLRRFDEALESYDAAIAVSPAYAEAWNNRGMTLQNLGRIEQAIDSYQRSVEMDPHRALGLNGAAANVARLCDWEGRRRWGAELMRRLGEPGVLPISPFVTLGYTDDPALQLEAARRHAAAKLRGQRPPLWTGQTWKNERIRVAYLSADFHNHATAHLAAGLFEEHDRSLFEITGVDFGPVTGDAMQRRLIAAFDHFHALSDATDLEIARRLHEARIDIVVDMKGYTQDARPGIVAYRPAPIQVSWLGYPATMGIDLIDYVIADRVILSPDDQPFFPERIVRLPGSYQVNDARRPRPGRAPSRRALGLPPDGFVFCSFNVTWKITPEVFDVWMRLLTATPGAVLWLMAGDETARRNLAREAQARGVDPARLIFADPVAPDAHMARLAAADLMLDTVPCNAHTTASDALWAGLPLVTCMGRSLASRVAASVLSAANLPDLTVDSLAEYEALALSLASDPTRLAAARARVAAARDAGCPLFDTAAFARNIESAYRVIWTRWQEGRAPEAFDV